MQAATENTGASEPNSYKALSLDVSKSSISSTYSNSATHNRGGAHMTRVSNIRVLFMVCVAVTSAILGVTTFRLLTDSEETLAQEQFASISDRALDMWLGIALRKKQGLVTLASMAEQAFPNAETWPFIEINGFEVVSNNVIKASSGGGMGLLPLVTPEQLAGFQDFANDLYPERGVTTVRGVDGDLNEYNETDGETYWGSPYRIFAPFLYHSSGDLMFLFNYHSLEKSRGRELDNVIACSEKRAIDIRENEGRDDFVPMECSSVTGIIDLRVLTGPVFAPAAVTTEPIYPANNRSVLAGFVTSAITWRDTLVNVFSSEVNGVHCVLKTEAQVYTYEVINGDPILKGEGDLHDRDFSSYRQTVALNNPGLYSTSSPNYTLCLYPTQDFFEVYATNNPVNATVGAVCTVILTTCIFLLYDFFVRKEFNHKEALQKAKRQFVRYISHEVRTPLNTVCMGLQLLQDELERLTRALVMRDDDTIVNESSSCPLSISTELGDQLKLQGKMTELANLSNDILDNAITAVDVLNDMLNYDKVESGTLDLELTVISIWELIEHTFFEFHQQAHFKEINCVLDYSTFEEDEENGIDSASQLPQDVKNRKVIGDKVRISQVLRNLISNALKFTPERGILTIRPSWKKNTQNEVRSATNITLHSGEEASYLRCGDLQVEVTDTGSGMTKEQLSKLFGEGVQFNVNELQAGQGSGLGLYIAKGMLEKHAGSLKATSEGIGCGTVFTMTIPMHYVPDPPKLEGAEDPPTQRKTALEKIGPMNLLIVDDSAMSRKMLARLLQNQGHVCDQAKDGLVAVQRVKDVMNAGNYYDAILMDYEMPRMNGPSAASEIRALGSDSFIVGVTGNLFPEDVSYFKGCGANLIFPKPLNLHILMETFADHGIGTPPE